MVIPISLNVTKISIEQSSALERASSTNEAGQGLRRLWRMLLSKSVKASKVLSTGTAQATIPKNYSCTLHTKKHN